MEQELAHAVNASSKAMDRVYSKPRTAEVPAPFRPALCTGARGPAAGCVFWFPQGLTGSGVLDMVNNFRALRSETELLLAGRVALVSWARAPAVGGRVQRAGRSGPDRVPGLRKPGPL